MEYLLTAFMITWGAIVFINSHKKSKKYSDGRVTKYNPFTDKF
ncbi:MAG TPA: hypothetical protein VMY77_11805 [Chitinophagaceae bacterium]|nr:hypothetical protein [Chitinophagaceae bacterium]